MVALSSEAGHFIYSNFSHEAQEPLFIHLFYGATGITLVVFPTWG